MKTEDLIEAFREMSPEDQATIRAELLSNGTEKGCCSGPEMEQLKQMMSKMQKSKNPMAMCMEMMRMCHEKMSSGSACGD